MCYILHHTHANNEIRNMSLFRTSCIAVKLLRGFTDFDLKIIMQELHVQCLKEQERYYLTSILYFDGVVSHISVSEPLVCSFENLSVHRVCTNVPHIIFVCGV